MANHFGGETTAGDIPSRPTPAQGGGEAEMEVQQREHAESWCRPLGTHEKKHDGDNARHGRSLRARTNRERVAVPASGLGTASAGKRSAAGEAMKRAEASRGGRAAHGLPDASERRPLRSATDGRDGPVGGGTRQNSLELEERTRTTTGGHERQHTEMWSDGVTYLPRHAGRCETGTRPGNPPDEEESWQGTVAQADV